MRIVYVLSDFRALPQLRLPRVPLAFIQSCTHVLYYEVTKKLGFQLRKKMVHCLKLHDGFSLHQNLQRLANPTSKLPHFFFKWFEVCIIIVSIALTYANHKYDVC